jgi:hypothetical protein
MTGCKSQFTPCFFLRKILVIRKYLFMIGHERVFLFF